MKFIDQKLSWLDRLKKRFGLHVHNKQLFVIPNSDAALVKCIDCGAESLPWRIPIHLKEWAKEAHKDDIKEYVKIEERIKLGFQPVERKE